MKDKKTKIYDKDRLKLVLLPPREDVEVTRNDVKNFYKNLTNIFISEN